MRLSTLFFPKFSYCAGQTPQKKFLNKQASELTFQSEHNNAECEWSDLPIITIDWRKQTFRIWWIKSFSIDCSKQTLRIRWIKSFFKSICIQILHPICGIFFTSLCVLFRFILISSQGHGLGGRDSHEGHEKDQKWLHDVFSFRPPNIKWTVGEMLSNSPLHSLAPERRYQATTTMLVVGA